MANKYKEAKQMINRFIGVGRLTKDPDQNNAKWCQCDNFYNRSE